MSGAGGLIGRALAPALEGEGHAVSRLVRRSPREPGEYRWDPARGSMDPDALAGCDALIHLAGESIAAGPWTAGRRARIMASRRDGTRLISAAVARARPAPGTLISVSAVGIYGDRGDEPLDESSPPGDGFLADVARAWEGEARAAADAGVRVVHPRFGVVLDRRGGALPRLALPFRLGLGGPLGTGRQWMSWITLADAVRSICFALSHNEMKGPVNVVSPRPVTNAELSRAIASALRRPNALRVPGWAIRGLLGGMGEELLLASQRAIPVRLLASGFTFRDPSIDEALRSVL